MYKTMKVSGTEPGKYTEELSYSGQLKKAIEKINAENGKIVFLNPINVPEYEPIAAGSRIKFINVTAVIIYEVEEPSRLIL